ncbi:MAG: lincosamide nucleotidyltransferase Lnu(F) [Anaerolineae bacterium]|nr:lincosamide nucleotidyltransferase Lnu(F) [Anaerolineae bacterium]
MLPQKEMIERVKQLCKQDERLVAAMMYGSFTQGEGDEYSDIEFSLYFQDDKLSSVDKLAWVSQVAPVLLFFTNEFGVETAIFDNLIRGEFHFEPASQMGKLRSAAWGMTPRMNSQKMLLLDTTLELADHLAYLKNHVPDRADPENVQQLARLYLNWMLFGVNVLRRGERARAHELLNIAHRYLLWLARIAEHQVDHWPTPSRALEQELSETSYQRFASCTSSLHAPDLERAYLIAWTWGKEMIASLTPRSIPGRLIDQLDKLFAALSEV